MLLPLLSVLLAGSLQEDPGFELRVQDSVTVQEGLCVHVPCSFSFPGVGGSNSTPAYGSWYQIKNPKVDVLMATNNPARRTKRKNKFPFHLPGDPGAGNCSLSITDAQRGHGGNYYFHLDRGLTRHTYKSNRLTVHVRALTQTPDIRVKEPLESGCPSHLTCSVPGACDGSMPLTISWTGTALRAPGLDLEASNSSEILLTPRPQDHGTNLTCWVTFPRVGVSTQSTIMLNVSYAPQNLSIGISRGNCTELTYPGNGSSLPVLEGESLLLVCAAESNPPATLSWVLGGQTLSPSQPTDPGILELPQIQMEHEGDLTCQAQNSLGSQHVSLHLSVVYPPRLLSPSCSWEGEGLHCSCSSRAQPAPTLRWRLGEGLLEGNHSNASWTITSSSAGPWANSSLSLSGPLGSGLRLSCEAWNAHGKQSMAILVLPGKPELGGGFVLGAVGGAGVAGLLSLFPCLIFFMVKICRKQALEPAARGKDVACTLGPLSRGCQTEYPSGTPPPCLPPAVAAPTLEEDQELHYASLTFHELRPWKPQDPEGLSTTKYSEIKICK
ncbi:sialic acid-binding Ig-like lectin 11 isoform X1 [Mirounga leonina]|uniref:sialic acid-binding Ig-like lectin 11 isoform X1 n=1 Tax=Mirounga leonina TaxID=9715 RepID=UPI00156C0963|nr:sialic acid-binding Ig-like lectin 11 isoform X1 [Mirounga leonina]